MRKRIDILFGLLAWLCVLATYIGYYLPSRLFNSDYLFFLPALWAASLGGVLIFRRRPLIMLWWVWPSILPTFYFWMGPVLLLISLMRAYL